MDQDDIILDEHEKRVHQVNPLCPFVPSRLCGEKKASKNGGSDFDFLN